MRWIGLCLAIMPALMPRAAPAAQTDERWAQTIAQIAVALAEGDPAALAECLGEDARIQQLDGRASDALRLLAGARGHEAVVVLAYDALPAALASDMARQVQSSTLPPEIKRWLTPVGDAAQQRANAVARQWLGRMLGTEGGEPVGLIALWQRPTEDGPARGELMLVLVGGRASDAGWCIRNICFGRAAVGN